MQRAPDGAGLTKARRASVQDAAGREDDDAAAEALQQPTS